MQLDLTGNNVMVDLETMGNGADAAIVAIGAVRFDQECVYDAFYSNVTLESSVAAGLIIDPSTVMWWLKQSDAARAAISEAQGAPDKCCLPHVLSEFASWLHTDQMMQSKALDEPRIWGNGAAFDNVILANAYKACGMPVPWKFWNDRCYRTVKNMAPDIVYMNTGTAHHALHDAEAQARHLIQIASA